MEQRWWGSEVKDVFAWISVSLVLALQPAAGYCSPPVKTPFLPGICSLAKFFFFFFFWATPVAHGGSQASGPIGATAAGLYHSHSNAASELHL